MDASITYDLALAVHSSLRWLVLVLLVLALVRAIAGAISDAQRGAGAKALGLFSTIALDVQILVGLGLHLFLSPTTRAAMQDMGASMKDPEQRFWAVEHGVLMILGALVIHAGRFWARRARSNRAEDTRLALTLLLGLAMIVARTPWPFTAIARPWFRLPSF